MNGNGSAFLALLLAMILWGSSFVAMKIAVLAYPPFVVVFGRLLVASAFFYLILSRIKPRRLPREHLKLMLLMSAFEPCLYFICESYALKYTSASLASLIVSTMPLMVGIAAAFFLGEHISLLTIAGFITAISGVVVLTLAGNPDLHSPNPILGNTLEFLAMIMGTGYTLIVRLLSRDYHPFFMAAVQSFAGSLFFLPLALWQAHTHELRWDPYATGAVVFLGIMVSVIAYGCYNYGVAKTSAARAAAFINLIPVVSVVMGWALLGETLNSTQIFGALLVIAGIMMSQGCREERPERAVGISVIDETSD
ncbi:DMT family transporter [Thermodesulforhabdus norvegica]|uniref:Permease of the drug/metabolite transporter (DMT) superfamily n=1 Tax=Thermodesulforhabdus norvegica TaxID=39841 RepID=A0A1I4QRS2_9BACT|nr:DMT family transporter [Thermodesulforhabdus norvegica]SFM42410.1 Permease of the drug/metabolite transporter (DMT) superfamily [Thermodesulforhabdus norvegica]